MRSPPEKGRFGQIVLTRKERLLICDTSKRLRQFDRDVFLLYRFLLRRIVQRLTYGFALPYHTPSALEEACLEGGFTRESLIGLYRVGLLDRPRVEAKMPAVLHLDPGYSGPLRPRRLPQSWEGVTPIH